jgi:O-antigen/teichoic acid export membrane protein
MSLVRRITETLKQDHTLVRVVRNSGYLFTSNVISAILSIVTANILGVTNLGALAIVMSFVSNVNRLLSFRMGDVVVRYMGAYLAQNEKEKAAAIVKAAGLTEAITSIAAYIILILLAPLGARYIVKDPASTSLIILFGLSILGMVTTETATGVLQVGDHYKSQSLINLIQAAATALVIVYAVFTHGGILVVLWAYLIGKLIAGLGPILMALYRLREMLGEDWQKASFSLLPSKSELIKFALSTNFSGTINMIVRDSEVLWVGLLFDKEVAGYYKTALAVINLVIMPINPFIATTYPEITRSIATRAWKQLRKLLRRVTIIAGGWTAAVAVGLLVLGKQILFTPWIPWKGHLAAIYIPEYLPSLPIILVLLIGFGVANAFYWNRSLLLGFGKADLPLKVSFWAMLVKVTLTVTLVPRLGYIWEAIFLSGYLAVTVIILLVEGFNCLRAEERQAA